MSSPCRKPKRLRRLSGVFTALFVLALSTAGSAHAQLCCGAVEPTAGAVSATQPANRVLRVAADPNNLPFSNDKLEGFENKLAELIAKDLGRDLVYTWRAQRRGFFRHTLKEGDSDVVIGVPSRSEVVLVTRPYYRSSYAFVTKKGRPPVESFDDPSLTRLRIGVQLVGDDGVNTPPVHVLAARGIVNNVVGYTVYGDYSQANPPARVVDAVAGGELDVAVAWGPLAGYFAKRSKVPLVVTPTPARDERTTLPLAFDISVGVRRDSPELRNAIDEILRRREREIAELLDGYGVPKVPVEKEADDTASRKGTP